MSADTSRIMEILLDIRADIRAELVALVELRSELRQRWTQVDAREPGASEYPAVGPPPRKGPAPPVPDRSADVGTTGGAAVLPDPEGG